VLIIVRFQISINYLVNMCISYICNPSVAQSIELTHSTQFRQLQVDRNCCQCPVYAIYKQRTYLRVWAAPDASTPCLWLAWAAREWIEVVPYISYVWRYTTMRRASV